MLGLSMCAVSRIGGVLLPTTTSILFCLLFSLLLYRKFRLRLKRFGHENDDGIECQKFDLNVYKRKINAKYLQSLSGIIIILLYSFGSILFLLLTPKFIDLQFSLKRRVLVIDKVNIPAKQLQKMEITQTEKLNYLSVNVQAAIKEQTSILNEKKQENDQNQSLSNVQQKISVQNQPKLSSSSKFNQQIQSTSNETQDISEIKPNQVNQMVDTIQRNHQTSQKSKEGSNQKIKKKLSGAISLTLKKQQDSELPIKKFQLQLSNYSFIFELMNDKFIVKGETQNGRECMKQTFTYQNFTEQMKALFQSTEDIWTILYSDKQSIEFQDFKLSFKIYLGEKEKKINIPLKRIEYSDKEYIEKLQKTVIKYVQLTKQLQNELNRQKSQCTCKNQVGIVQMNPKAKGKVESDRDWLSRASSTWPQFENEHKVYQGQTEDHLVLFEEMIEKMNKMRDEFSDLAQQINQKILNGSGIKVIRIKFLVLEKRKKDCSKVLEQYSQKFASFQCKSDIEVQIDQLQSFMIAKYETIKSKITLIKDAN